jgi:hypothetical protein
MTDRLNSYLEAVQDELRVQVLVLLLQNGLEVRSTVTHLIVVIHHAARQKDQNVGQQVIAESAEAGQSGHRSRSYSGVLKYDSVINVPDVSVKKRQFEGSHV